MKRIRDTDDLQVSIDDECIVVSFGDENEFYIGIECENGTVVTKFFLENDDIVVEVEWDRKQETFVVTKILTRQE